MAHNISNTTHIPLNLLPISMKEWEQLFDVVNVFSPEDWADILEVPQICVWAVLAVTERKVQDGSSMVVATISPEFETLFDDQDVICYIQTEQQAKDHRVDLTITDLVGLGMNLSGEIKAALKVLDAMNSGTDRDMRPGGVNWTPKWNLQRIRQFAPSRSVFQANMRNVGRAALDLSIELLPYARVFVAGVVFGRLIEAGAREAAEAGK